MPEPRAGFSRAFLSTVSLSLLVGWGQVPVWHRNSALPAAAAEGDSRREFEAGWELTQPGPVPASLPKGGGGGRGHDVSQHSGALGCHSACPLCPRCC